MIRFVDEISRQYSNSTVAAAFFKCTRWEEDQIDFRRNCRYHYSCERTFFNGDYPPAVDVLVCFLAIVCYILCLFFTVLHVGKSPRCDYLRRPRRCLLVSGPILLPLLILVLSNGHRINTAFPLAHMGPVLLQLVHLSVLAFATKPERTILYAVIETSTASGILRASIYLDAVILPYHTGLDALLRSTMSGECETCVCRDKPLTVGGDIISYRGLSSTTFCVIGTLCSRMVCGLFGKDALNIIKWIEVSIESIGWGLILKDCIFLMVDPPKPGSPELVAKAAVGFLIILHISQKIYRLALIFDRLYSKRMKRNHIDGGYRV
ncbi:hypothetical protein ZOSMA_106G00610 [Zostera marina]|uniref:Uncharacterized protein n=1 Tax=Zostera marina TaxID=29655 RepID=A0A0K9Q636_ZOSMR|nr:hypothetical protein ZOSMA_106G00610 [Zostera marina]